MFIKSLARRALLVLLISSSFCPSVHSQPSFSREQFTADFDHMWSRLREDYSNFDSKTTDWTKVRELYRPGLAEVSSRSEFVTLLERVLEELYDNHTSLNTNLNSSPRLVPTGLDVWAEWLRGRAIITQVRGRFSAEQAGLRPGMEIASINGTPIETAVARRLPKSLTTTGDGARNWALRAVLAGTHDQPRTVGVRSERGRTVLFRLDLSGDNLVDAHQYVPKVDWEMLPGQIGYIKINDLISAGIVSQFDSALEGVRESRGLILDLRDIPRGGNTDVAEPIMGRLIQSRMGYQQVVPLRKPAYTKEVSPRGPWTYKAPVVVLVNRWTASMGEGIAIGLDGMKRATIVGTRMAGLNGGVFNLELPHTKIGVTYPGEKLNHINGTPREDFVPGVQVNLIDRRFRRVADPILEIGSKELTKLIGQRSDVSVTTVDQTSKDLEARVREFVAAFNERNIGGMLELTDESVQWLMVDGAKVSIETEGKPALRRSMEKYFRSCPSCKSTIEWTRRAGSRVTALERASWTSKGASKSQRSLSVYEFRGDKILRVYYFPVDATEAFEQSPMTSRASDLISTAASAR